MRYTDTRVLTPVTCSELLSDHVMRAHICGVGDRFRDRFVREQGSAGIPASRGISHASALDRPLVGRQNASGIRLACMPDARSSHATSASTHVFASTPSRRPSTRRPSSNSLATRRPKVRASAESPRLSRASAADVPRGTAILTAPRVEELDVEHPRGRRLSRSSRPTCATGIRQARRRDSAQRHRFHMPGHRGGLCACGPPM
jgi:hypothetical protein